MSKKSNKGRLSLPNAAAKVENAAGAAKDSCSTDAKIYHEAASAGIKVAPPPTDEEAAAELGITVDDFRAQADAMARGAAEPFIDSFIVYDPSISGPMNTDADTAIELVAAHFGITADELRARVEAGPVEEVDPDDLDLDGVGKGDVAGVPDKVYAAIVKPEGDPQDDFAERLTLAYVAERKKGFGPAAMTVSAATERPYITRALDAVMKGAK